MSEKYNREELIVRYLQQEINEEELRVLEAWLEESAENKSDFFQLKNISDLSRCPLPGPEDKNEADRQSEKSWQRMKGRIEKEEALMKTAHSPQPSRNQPFAFYLKYAAIVIVALSTGWGISESGIHLKESIQIENQIVYNEIRVQKGGRANTLILSDGSKVVLNAATTFKYPTSFNSKNRIVYLDGEAYFEVAKDADKPFIVKAKRQDITVLGTSFNVEAYSSTPFSVITLLSGSISLKAFNDKGEMMSQMFLKPNQSALSNNSSGSVSIQNMQAELATSWMNGEYKFKDTPLIFIVKQLENYYDVRIHLEDKKLRRIRYTGTFSLDQNIEEVLKIIDYKKQFIFKKAGKDIYITNN